MTRWALTQFEKLVLDACLAGDHPLLEVLRHQLDAVTVIERKHTGVGAYVEFAVDDAAPRLDAGTFVIDDLDLGVEGVGNGVATLLYAYDGRLQCLEFAPYDDAWPEDPTLAGIGYLRARPVGPEAVAFEPVKQRDAETIARVLIPRHSEG